jgi:predicted nucleotidyltransferase
VTPLEEALRALPDQLDRFDAKWALVGGFAVSARSEPRFTRDIDIAIAVESDEQAEALVRSLLGEGYHILASVEQDDAGRLATIRLARATRGSSAHVVVDLLFASSGIEPEIVSAAERVEILAGLTLPVATVGHLIALKILARDDDNRPQDAADLRSLMAVATDDDRSAAAAAADLIARRGFARGRDLRALLREFATS